MTDPPHRTSMQLLKRPPISCSVLAPLTMKAALCSLFAAAAAVTRVSTVSAGPLPPSYLHSFAVGAAESPVPLEGASDGLVSASVARGANHH